MVVKTRPATFLPKVVSNCFIMNPLMLIATKSSPDIIYKILEAKAQLRKYLMDKCQLEHYLQLSFKYFVKHYQLQKLLSKVSEIQQTISGGTLSINGISYLQKCQRSRRHFSKNSSMKILEITCQGSTLRVNLWPQASKNSPKQLRASKKRPQLLLQGQ